MNKNIVVIKGNKYGLTLILDETIDFLQLKEHLASKIKDASKFFENAELIVSFEGRDLTSTQQKELVDIITTYSTINIIYIMDKNEKNEQIFKKELEKRLEEMTMNTGQFYKGTLRSGQILEVDQSIVIIGDINPGAKVISKGNIIVIGSIKGSVYAGANGNALAYVIALNMMPMQIKIGEIIARSPDTPIKSMNKKAKIAYVEDDKIYIEPISKNNSAISIQ